jgi:hypothetical protein
MTDWCIMEIFHISESEYSTCKHCSSFRLSPGIRLWRLVVTKILEEPTTSYHNPQDHNLDFHYMKTLNIIADSKSKFHVNIFVNWIYLVTRLLILNIKLYYNVT